MATVVRRESFCANTATAKRLRIRSPTRAVLIIKSRFISITSKVPSVMRRRKGRPSLIDAQSTVIVAEGQARGQGIPSIGSGLLWRCLEYQLQLGVFVSGGKPNQSW